MNVIDYCKGMEKELTAWKANVYDPMRKVETLGTREREKVLPNIQDLHIFNTDMSSRIEELKSECPTQWSPQKKEINKGSVDVPGKHKQTMDYIGKYAPVPIPG